MKSPSQSSRPTTVNPVTAIVRRPNQAIVALSVMVVGVIGWLAWQQWQTSDDELNPQGNVTPQIGVSIPDSSLQHKAEVAKDDGKESNTIEAPPTKPIPPLGEIASRWKSEFGAIPREISWGRPMDYGSAKIDEEVRSLVVQARKSIRLVQLGEVKDNNQAMTLRFRTNNQSRRGSYGVFFGFRKDEGDIPEFIEFQLIAVVYLSTSPMGDTVIVRRSHEKYDIRTGNSDSIRNHHVRMQLPAGTDSHQFELRREGESISEIRFCGNQCVELCTPMQNSYYLRADYEGPFGLFVEDCSVWFNSPHLEGQAK